MTCWSTPETHSTATHCHPPDSIKSIATAQAALHPSWVPQNGSRSTSTHVQEYHQGSRLATPSSSPNPSQRRQTTAGDASLASTVKSEASIDRRDASIDPGPRRLNAHVLPHPTQAARCPRCRQHRPASAAPPGRPRPRNNRRRSASKAASSKQQAGQQAASRRRCSHG